MSAATHPSPPVEQPSRAAPQGAPRRPTKHWFAKVLLLLGSLAAGGAVAYQLWLKSQKPAAAPGMVASHTAKVFVGPVDQITRLAGQTAAGNYANITAPMNRGREGGSAMVLLYLAKSGAMVRKGDVVARIDAQSVQDHVDDLRDTVRQATSDIEIRKAEQAVEWENLLQTIRVAKADLEKAQWDAKASEVKTEVERELLKLSVDEAAARYKQLQSDLVNRKASQQAELRILQLTLEQHKQHIGRHLHDLEHYTVKAPMDGMVVLQSVFRGGDMMQVQQGDQLRSRQPFMKIVDPHSMQIEASVNQSESEELRLGQPVKIGLDAFPDVTLRGKVASIGALAVGGWRENYYIRNIPVRITITDFDPRVIPDLSAYGDVRLSHAENALQVPLAAVHLESGRPFVYVRNGEAFERRAVTLGTHSNVNAAVTEGLQAGEEVLLN